MRTGEKVGRCRRADVWSYRRHDQQRRTDAAVTTRAPEEEWDRTIDVNIKGVLDGIAAALPHMKQQKFGHIINVTSAAGHKVGPGFVVHAATNHAVRTLSEGLRQEVKPYNIRTTVISPGAVATELPNSVAAPDMAGSIHEFYNEIAIPAESFARTVAFAISQPEDVDVNEILFRPPPGPVSRGRAPMRVGTPGPGIDRLGTAIFASSRWRSLARLHRNQPWKSRHKRSDTGSSTSNPRGIFLSKTEVWKLIAPMKIHCSPWKTLLVHSIVFAVLVSFAVHVQAQQNSIEKRGENRNRIERAEDKLHELFGSTQLSGRDLDPEFFDIMKHFTYGELFYQGSLDNRQRELIALVVLTTIQCLSEVRAHAGAALNIGVTPIEIKESLYQCAPFIGFPRVQEAIRIVNEVMLSRGISLPLDSQRRIGEGDRFEKGREIQFPIYGDRIKQTISTLPEEQRENLPRYLTELCFGDFYTRAGLDLQTRELLILCVLCALGGTDVQIKSHATGNLKVGNSRDTLVSAITFCLPFIGFPRTLNAINIVKDVSKE